MNFSIKHWPEQERPRERLIQQGADSLSDAELLAIFLRSGSRQHSAVELARMLLQHFGSLSRVLNASQEDLCRFHGMGLSKYSQLIAVRELGRRYTAQHLFQQKIEITSSAVLKDFLRFELLGETQEVFAVLCLDAELRKISFKKLFYGSLNSCEISINQLLRHTIQQHASSIVIAHNHPFGKAQPSQADMTLTLQIQQALNLAEIQLLDHCIITQDSFFSFAENDCMKLV
jgi:DNA repair protein RadC